MSRYQQRPPMPRQRYRVESMSVGKWIGTFILLMIPGINIIAWLVWLFGGGNNRTRTNWVRASLLMTIIVAAIGVIVFFAMGSSITNYLSDAGVTNSISYVGSLLL